MSVVATTRGEDDKPTPLSERLPYRGSVSAGEIDPALRKGSNERREQQQRESLNAEGAGYRVSLQAASFTLLYGV